MSSLFIIGYNLFITPLQNFEPMSKPITSEEIKLRFLQLLEENRLNISDELQIFEAISKKYKMKTITNYSKSEGLSYNGVLDRINREKCASFQIDKIIFCCM